ncbi:MAG: dTDP-4-dehydrorhamnose reductase [Flavobacterium sp.]|nr:MAG: dTDP-4-dehydrorhamnose reductase [Flavobacterium sp.]
MVVLVTGGNGQLGLSLQSIAADYPQIQFRFASSSEADVADKAKLADIFNILHPNFCINAAAYTAVDKAESEPERAELINVTGAANLAEICKDHNTTLVHVSTDFVFDGQKKTPYTEIDATNPTGVYGLTKLRGEQAIAKIWKKHFIVRTSWLYSEFANNFMKTMLRLSKERDTLGVVNDQIGTPTYAVDLAHALVKIILSNSSEYGVYHYSNEGQASWFDFAKEIFAVNDVNIALNPILTSQFPTPAKRPEYSVLDKTKIKNAFGLTIPGWRHSLKKMI